MSGYSEREVATRLVGFGPVGIIQKPFQHDELIGRLRRLLPVTAS